MYTVKHLLPFVLYNEVSLSQWLHVIAGGDPMLAMASRSIVGSQETEML